MCGIVAASLAGGEVRGLLITGLKSLEYRGYDSAGLCLGVAGLPTVKCKGRVDELAQRAEAAGLPAARTGIAHTRWASHGAPSEPNAHPHKRGQISVVHNGIFENFAQVKRELGVDGYASETDSEVWAALLEAELGARAAAPTPDDVLAAMARATGRARGAWALAVLHEALPGHVFFARQESPLVLGIGEDGRYVASDVPALLGRTRDFVYLEDGWLGWITDDAHLIVDWALRPVEARVEHITWDAEQAEKGGYAHYMLKEIEEQPEVVERTIQAATSSEAGFLGGFAMSEAELARFERIVVLACGTALHAGRYGRYVIEALAGLPVEVDFASEFRYRDPMVGPKDLVLAISQSGETADTLGALAVAIEKGATPIAICNVRGSSLTRVARATLLTWCGPEIGVASTKAFAGQLVALHLLGLKLALARGRLDAAGVEERVAVLRTLKGVLASQVGPEAGARFTELAHKYAGKPIYFFLGRGADYPMALEGALKLKEISYVHAEGYPAGEMKHGPLALVSDDMVIVGLAGPSPVHEKTLGNLREVRARGGNLVVLTTEDMDEARELADDVVLLPACDPWIAPLAHLVPLQYLAYHVALERGCDIDKPRNLAKSVTIE
ncbi:MAG: glutamine--fructose-6-phosphate transaminase (isomerizing) [Planctomycetota bacterium]